jgi:abortive infection bacteriophage resistance protein
MAKKTDSELIDDIRRSAREIRDVEHDMPIVGSVPFWQIQKLESYSNALHIYCKLLRQRLEAQQPTLTEGE